MIYGKDITRFIDRADEIVSQVNENSSNIPPDKIASLIRAVFSNFLSANDLADEIMRCFGIDETRRLIRYGSKESAKITLSPVSSQAEYNHSSLYKFTIAKGAFTTSIPDTNLQIGKDALEEYIQDASEGKIRSRTKMGR